MRGLDTTVTLELLLNDDEMHLMSMILLSLEGNQAIRVRVINRLQAAVPTSNPLLSFLQARRW